MVAMIRSKGFAWREDDVCDRFAEWSALLCGAELESEYWTDDWAATTSSDDESLVDVQDRTLDAFLSTESPLDSLID